MFNLQGELQRLKNRGEASLLVAELEALVEATSDAQGIKEEPSKTSLPISHKFLTLAVQQIKEGNLQVSHDCLGVAVEAYLAERGGKEFSVSEKLSAYLSKIEADKFEADPFMVPIQEEQVEKDSPDFESSSGEVISSFVNILLNAGYAVEAKKYLEGYNQILGEFGMKEKDTLKKLKAKFLRESNLAMAKTVDEILAELGDAEEPKTEEKENLEMAEDKKTEETKEPSITPVNVTDPNAPVTEEKAEEEKPTLEVEPASEEEEKAKEEATASIKKGDHRKAKECLAKAQKLEKNRLIAALIKAGDSELAMEGIEEDAEQAGYKAEEKEEVEEKEEQAESKMPEEKKDEVKIDETVSEPEKTEEDEEGEIAESLFNEVKSSVKAKQMKKAKTAFAKVQKLEKMVVAGLQNAEEVKKDEALAREGYQAWRKVRLQRLKAEAFLAKAENDKEVYDKAMEAAKELEDEIKTDPEALDDSATAEELTKDLVTPAGGLPEGGNQTTDTPAEELDVLDAEGKEDEDLKWEEEKEEGKEEAEAMKYEVLQSMEEIKATKVDRNNLGFMLWENKEDPHWVVQASGKPVAEVHLKDQDNAEDIKAFFCDENKWPQAIAQSVEKVGLYEMLKGVHARFYANEINKSSYAKEAKEAALASITEIRKEKLADLRKDLSDAIMVAAESLNKGLIQNKPNALKAAFAKTLSNYGIAQPALVVEAAFKEGFSTFMEQVLADAQGYLEMHKEAFEQTKKVVASMTNVSFVQASNLSDATFSGRLARTSVPLTHVPEAEEAPVVQDIQAQYQEMSQRNQKDAMKNRLGLSRK